MAAVAAALLVAPAQGHAIFKFGSELDSTVQPSNGTPAHECDENAPGTFCTWVMNEAYGRPDTGHKAPRKGIIKRIRLIAGEAGSFRLQIARAFESGDDFQGKVVRRGPVINYQGQPDDDEPYVVEVFKVNIPIKKGARLAIKTASTSTLRCSSGGDNTLLFNPPLALGGGLGTNSGSEGCWMLIEAVAVKPPRRR